MKKPKNLSKAIHTAIVLLKINQLNKTKKQPMKKSKNLTKAVQMAIMLLKINQLNKTKNN